MSTTRTQAIKTARIGLIVGAAFIASAAATGAWYATNAPTGGSSTTFDVPPPQTRTDGPVLPLPGAEESIQTAVLLERLHGYVPKEPTDDTPDTPVAVEPTPDEPTAIASELHYLGMAHTPKGPTAFVRYNDTQYFFAQGMRIRETGDRITKIEPDAITLMKDGETRTLRIGQVSNAVANATMLAPGPTIINGRRTGSANASKTRTLTPAQQRAIDRREEAIRRSAGNTASNTPKNGSAAPNSNAMRNDSRRLDNTANRTTIGLNDSDNAKAIDNGIVPATPRDFPPVFDGDGNEKPGPDGLTAEERAMKWAAEEEAMRRAGVVPSPSSPKD